MKGKIKLKAATFPYLEDQINGFKRYGFELVEIRAARWYEDLCSFVAIMQRVDEAETPKKIDND